MIESRAIMRFESDEALMEAVSYGRKDAFNVLVDRYMPIVSRTTFRILCDQADSDVVTQAVFRKVWKMASGFDGRTTLSVWIYGITSRLCLWRLHLRKFPGILSLPQSVYETSSPEPLFTEEDYVTKEAWEIFCRASLEMTPSQRVVFALCELEGLSVEDLQTVTGLSAERIKDNLSIARNKVRSELEAYGKVR